jgi:hypothetical protein
MKWKVHPMNCEQVGKESVATYLNMQSSHSPNESQEITQLPGQNNPLLVRDLSWYKYTTTPPPLLSRQYAVNSDTAVVGEEVPKEEEGEQTKQYITIIENTHIIQMYIGEIFRVLNELNSTP